MSYDARLHFTSDMSYGYIEGYRKAALLLAIATIEKEKDVDYLVYPLGFLWRHHFELQLKYLVAKAGQLDGSFDKNNHGHSLSKLWQNLRPKLEQLNPLEKKFLMPVDEAVSLLAEFDDSSQEFRYTQKKVANQLQPSLPIHSIDLKHLNGKCKAAAENLQCIHEWIKIEVDSYVELLWHMQNEKSDTSDFDT